jgi:hypothetical protein
VLVMACLRSTIKSDLNSFTSKYARLYVPQLSYCHCRWRHRRPLERHCSSRAWPRDRRARSEPNEQGSRGCHLVSQNQTKGDISGVGSTLIVHFHPGSSRMRPSEYRSQLGCPLLQRLALALTRQSCRIAKAWGIEDELISSGGAVDSGVSRKSCLKIWRFVELTHMDDGSSSFRFSARTGTFR